MSIHLKVFFTYVVALSIRSKFIKVKKIICENTLLLVSLVESPARAKNTEMDLVHFLGGPENKNRHTWMSEPPT